ncbi:MAG: hypothetical protein J7604_08725 [Sporocytophaga sp.]|uniref:hypothetical protein n=1 Tax=Sporocytophaga sp. TaxID=2231183 RepID=UPI001B1C1214|nr:hypothetical protein [Sporocytophaga sp.]MBO9700281.1 hypothetical protein [Sporocytophaga sp.]
MEKDQVPQDHGVLEGVRKVIYATDKNGTYTKVKTAGWEPENVALDQAWEVINEKVEAARQKVLAGKASPLLFHLEKNMITKGMLAELSGISWFKIIWHLRPSAFAKLNQKTLEKYARALNISVAQLKKTE